MKKIALVAMVFLAIAGAWAQTNIEFWHAMTGKNAETVQALADRFNATQKDFKVVPVFKGSYSDTMNAGIAAFRAGQAPQHEVPDLLQRRGHLRAAGGGGGDERRGCGRLCGWARGWGGLRRNRERGAVAPRRGR